LRGREGAGASKIILVSPPRQEGQEEGSQTRPLSACSLPTLILSHYVPNEEPGRGPSHYRAASLGRSGTDKFRYRSHIEAGYLIIEPDDPYFESAGVDVKMLGKLWQYRYGDDEGVYFGEESQLGEPCDDSDLDIPSHLLSFR
jgi:hypothetical protein